MATDELKTEAHMLVDQLRTRNPSGPWLNIDAKTITDSLDARIDDPDLIDTGLVNLCGPGAFVRFVAEDNPANYARMGINLFETGRTVLMGTGKLAGRLVTAGYDLLTHPVPNTTYTRGDGSKGALDPADWIILASIRDSDNWFFDYQDENDAVAGITTPHSMENWMRAAGYTNIVNETNLFFTKNLENARQASTLRGQGYKVTLLINSNMLYDKEQDDPSWFPDHWIGLVSDLQFNGNPDLPEALVDAKIHSWGEVRDIAEHKTTRPLTVEVFLQNYYGFLACKY